MGEEKQALEGVETGVGVVHALEHPKHPRSEFRGGEDFVDMLAKQTVGVDFSRVRQLLEVQYEATVSFCNAQTNVLNTMATSSKMRHRDEGLLIVLEEYNSSLRKVQENWVEIQKLQEVLSSVDSYRPIWLVYKAHVDRTRRVLQTVQGAGGGIWSCHGIPLSSSDIDVVTLGLATLRASIDTVTQVLSDAK